MLTSLQSQNYTIEYFPERLIILVNPRRDAQIGFFGLWFLLYVVFFLLFFPWLYHVLGIIFTNSWPRTNQGWLIFGFLSVVAMVLLVGWILRIGIGLYLFLWQITGKEKIEVTPRSIRIHNQIIGIDRKKEYNIEDVSDLQSGSVLLMPFPLSIPLLSKSFKVPVTGPIVLKLAGKGIRLGLGLAEEEGKAILDVIYQQFPQFKRLYLNWFERQLALEWAKEEEK